MKNKVISHLAPFEPYVCVLHRGFTPESKKSFTFPAPEDIFQLTHSCKAGKAKFDVFEKSTSKPPPRPKHCCYIDVDKLYPNPPDRQKKCDSVFIILNNDTPIGNTKDYSAINHLRYCCFGELKDSKIESQEDMFEQIMCLVKLFKEKLEAAGYSKAFPNSKIIGVLCGGSMRNRNFNQFASDAQRKYGISLKQIGRDRKLELEL
jgi:hypothetical protein